MGCPPCAARASPAAKSLRGKTGKKVWGVLPLRTSGCGKMANPPRPDVAAHTALLAELNAAITAADEARARAQATFLRCRDSSNEAKVRGPGGALLLRCPPPPPLPSPP